MRLTSRSLLAVALATALAVLPSPAGADPAADFAAKEKQLTEAAAQVKSLSDQLKLLEETIQLKSAYVAELQADQEKTRADLAEINADLEKMQRDRLAARRKLLHYVRNEYTERPANAFLVIADERSLSGSVVAKSYLASLQTYTNDIAKQIARVEQQIEDRQRKVQEAYRTLDAKEAEANRETAELEGVRANQRSLLAATQGDEDRFRQEFESAKRQLAAQGSFARSARQRIGSRVWDGQGNYFNQLDSRWIDGRLGFSDDSTLGDYGCGVASLAMVYKYYGLDVTPPSLNDDLKRVRAFVDDLLDWRQVAAASQGRLELVNSPYPVGASRVDWDLIDRQLAAGNPVIVYVQRPGQVNHYVVLLDKRSNGYVMHDPIEGPYLRFSDYYRTSAVVQFITFRQS